MTFTWCNALQRNASVANQQATYKEDIWFHLFEKTVIFLTFAWCNLLQQKHQLQSNNQNIKRIYAIIYFKRLLPFWLLLDEIWFNEKATVTNQQPIHQDDVYFHFFAKAVVFATFTWFNLLQQKTLLANESPTHQKDTCTHLF